MITIRKNKERGYADHGWLQSYHTFSFAEYHDEKFMGHSVLRVINEDFIAPGSGFPLHGHRDMEIITYIIEGELEHKDSLGSIGTIQAGEIQRMSAGAGIRHSEYNSSTVNPTRLLQIWILPDRSGYQPSFEQINLKNRFQTQEMVLIASPNAQEGSALLHQNAKIYAYNIQSSRQLTLPVCSSRNGWLQLIDGSIQGEAFQMEAGDALKIEKEEAPSIQVQGKAHFLFFDLP